jgi:hypothetical protein
LVAYSPKGSYTDSKASQRTIDMARKDRNPIATKLDFTRVPLDLVDVANELARPFEDIAGVGPVEAGMEGVELFGIYLDALNGVD